MVGRKLTRLALRRIDLLPPTCVGTRDGTPTPHSVPRHAGVRARAAVADAARLYAVSSSGVGTRPAGHLLGSLNESKKILTSFSPASPLALRVTMCLPIT